MPREEDTGPAPGPLLQRGTLSRGAVAGGIGLLALGGLAWLRADNRPEPPLEAYRRMGLTAGPPALRRDLLVEFPAGSAPAPLVRRLEGLGFACRPAEAAWTCLHVAHGEGRAVWEAEVTLRLAEVALAGLEVRFREAAR
ncbi:hypothetical protein E2C06_05445 [Dankookia rubra]|uniref:Uncharacterized protein n=1 Tax=Dankookia rubra TaxID=1442381 RepID=A0A4R5QJZ9_9PROT|nr:hypothetical protein [Dankookia rubra]TDH63772.1 hypothetical protein E2C06_05445 [Dankookia rubra]